MDLEETSIPSPLVISSTSEWMKEQLTLRMDQYSSKRVLQILVGSWNVNGKVPEESFQEWLLLKEAPDLVVLGFQEMDLSTDSYITGAKGSGLASLWCSLIEASLGTLYVSTEYAKISGKSMVGLFIVAYAKTDLLPHIHTRQSDSVGCGILGVLGNKGAVALRLDIDGQYFTFVNSHLAAHANQNSRRHQDYADICRRLNFAATKLATPPNPYSTMGDQLAQAQREMDARKQHLEGHASPLPPAPKSSSFSSPSLSSSSSPSSSAEPVYFESTEDSKRAVRRSKENGKTAFYRDSFSLSSSSSPGAHPSTRTSSSPAGETSISIFDSHFLFWFGDLNYRVSLPADAETDAWQLYDQGRCTELLAFDQLTLARTQGLAFHYFTEGLIDFAPTYKFMPGSSQLNRLDRKRVPSWCDRILWRQSDPVSLVTYTSCPSVILSDHKPVLSVFEAPVRIVQPERFQAARRQMLKELDFAENQGRPSVGLESHTITLKGLKLGECSIMPWTISNDGNVPLTFRFASLPGQLSPFPPWLTIEPATASLSVGESLTLTVHFSLCLRTDMPVLDSVLIFHIVNGRDQFVSVCVQLEPCFYGRSPSQLDCVLPVESPADRASGTDSPDSLGISIAISAEACPMLKFDPMDPMPQVELPLVLFRIFDYLITEDGLESKHMFLSSGSIEMINDIRCCLDTQQPFRPPCRGTKDRATFAQSMAEVILGWLGTLPRPLLDGIAIGQVSSSEEICRSLYSVPQLHAQIFVSLCWFLRQVLVSQSLLGDFTVRVTKLCLSFSLVLFSAEHDGNPLCPQFVEYSILGNISNMIKLPLR